MGRESDASLKNGAVILKKVFSKKHIKLLLWMYTPPTQSIFKSIQMGNST
jgi:hypothetical protein